MGCTSCAERARRLAALQEANRKREEEEAKAKEQQKPETPAKD